MKEIVLDTETTGISISEGHRIVEIGCLELDNLIPTKKKFHCYLNPDRKVSEKAFEIHGYSDDFLSKQKKFKEIVDDFLKQFCFVWTKRLGSSLVLLEGQAFPSELIIQIRYPMMLNLNFLAKLQVLSFQHPQIFRWTFPVHGLSSN